MIDGYINEVKAQKRAELPLVSGAHMLTIHVSCQYTTTDAIPIVIEPLKMLNVRCVKAYQHSETAPGPVGP